MRRSLRTARQWAPGRTGMKRKITDYHQDQFGDWVADLDCGHGQHVRHNPPFSSRPWVVTPEGRAGRIGAELDCVRCDRLEFPEGLREYRRTPEFSEADIPAGLLRDHVTRPGVWGLIHVLEGRLEYTVQEPVERSFELAAGDAGVVVPEMKHHVRPLGPVRFCVVFHAR